MVHLVHTLVVVLGAAVVVALLVPPHGARTRRLRRDAAGDALLARAEDRARTALGTARPGAAGPAGSVVVLAALDVGAGLVHALVTPEHLREAWYLGTFFLLLTAAQLALAAVLLRRPSRAALATAGLVSAATVVLWVVTRTVRVPFLPEGVEPVGYLDTLCSALEAAAVGCAVAAWAALPPGRRRPATTASRATATSRVAVARPAAARPATAGATASSSRAV